MPALNGFILKENKLSDENRWRKLKRRDFPNEIRTSIIQALLTGKRDRKKFEKVKRNKIRNLIHDSFCGTKFFKVISRMPFKNHDLITCGLEK